jgi:KDO2-lipid IV(A) lauroyltransferase
VAAPTSTGGRAASVRRGVPQQPERKRELLTYWAYRAAERLIGALPRGLVLPVAAAAGNAAHDVSSDKRAVMQANIGQAMGLAPDAPRVRRATRRAFRNYAKYLADVMRLPALSDAEVGRLIAIDNVEVLPEARAGDTGVLVCTVHVGGMDMIGPALHRAGEELHVVADDTTYGRLYDHLKAERARHGLHLIGWRNLRARFKVLRHGGTLVLFCAGGYRRGDVPVEFLGAPTTFPAGPATLSARSGAPMLPVWCQRTDRDTFIARGLPTIRAEGDDPASIQRATQALADALGSVIAEDPGQWYLFRAVWPATDAERAAAADDLERARRGEDWTVPGATA